MNSELRIRTTPPCRATRLGFTLVELLIVMVILGLLTVVALPMLSPGNPARRAREASRGLNTFISTVQAKAIGSRRPTGFALIRLSSNTGNADDRGVCLEVAPIEQPAPYAGFSESSAVRLALVPNSPNLLLQFVTPGQLPNTDGLPAGWDADLVPTGIIRIGDVVEVAGTRYRIEGVRGNITIGPRGYLAGPNGTDPVHDGTAPVPATLIVRPINNTGQLLAPAFDNEGSRLSSRRLSSIPTPPNPYWTEPVKYKVLRQPVITSATSYQLPSGTAIDLEASGVVGKIPFHFTGLIDNDQPIYVLFTPGGAVERVQYPINGATVSIAPTSDIALLIGRRELIPATDAIKGFTGTESEQLAERNKINWLNLESRWVNVGSQSGSVVTTENASVDVNNLNTIDFDGNGETPLNIRRSQILAAQEFAREKQQMGGK